MPLTVKLILVDGNDQYLDGAPVLSLVAVAVNVSDMKFTADAINNGFDFLSVIDW